MYVLRGNNKNSSDISQTLGCHSGLWLTNRQPGSSLRLNSYSLLFSLCCFLSCWQNTNNSIYTSCEQLLRFHEALLCVRIVPAESMLDHTQCAVWRFWAYATLSLSPYVFKDCLLAIKDLPILEFTCCAFQIQTIFSSIPQVLEMRYNIWRFSGGACLRVCRVSVCLCVWSACDPCNRLIRILWVQRLTGAGEERPCDLRVKRRSKQSRLNTLTLTVSSTSIYAVVPPFLPMWEFKRNIWMCFVILCHPFIRLGAGFQLSWSGNQMFPSSAANQKGF